MKNKLTLKFLGTSSGEAIPRDDDCPQCSSENQKDKRLRSALLVNEKILIDAGPDITRELSKKEVNHLESVLITHEHTDHIGGLGEIMRLNKNLKIIKLKAGQYFKIHDIEFHAFAVRHSKVIPTVGVEIENVLYIPDFADLDLAYKYLKEAQMAILDGSSLNRSLSGHLAMTETVALTKPLNNLNQIYFSHNGHTHLSHMEIEKIIQKLGDDRFLLAYDGLTIKI